MAGPVGAMLEDWPDGRIKMYLTLAALRFRRRSPALFLQGEYLPLTGFRPAADHQVGLAEIALPASLLEGPLSL